LKAFEAHWPISARLRKRPQRTERQMMLRGRERNKNVSKIPAYNRLLWQRLGMASLSCQKETSLIGLQSNSRRTTRSLKRISIRHWQVSKRPYLRSTILYLD